MTDLIKASNIKKHVNNLGLRLSKDAISQFERKLMLAIASAAKSAKDDSRTTVRAEDVY